MGKLKQQVVMGNGFKELQTEQDFLNLISVPNRSDKTFRLTDDQIEQANQEMLDYFDQEEQKEIERRFYTTKAMQEIIISF